MFDEYMTWDTILSEDDFCLKMRDVTLLKPIGDFPAGTVFEDAMIDFDQGVITFGSEDDDYPFSMDVSFHTLDD